MKIAIAGAGIGGLVAALSLKQAGFDDIQVYERVAELRPLGVGINLLPHAMRELTELGLADAVSAIGTAPAELSYHNRFGQRIWSEPRGVAAGYSWPQLSVHRGRLQMMLVDAVRERLGTDAIRLGHSVRSVTTAGGTAHAVFHHDGSPVEVDADVFVAADGINSAVRRRRHPEEGEPVWNGLILWRGTARVPAFLDERTMIMAGDDEQKFVAYPLSAPDADGLITVNFIAEIRTDGTRPAGADWNRPVAAAPIVELFRDWSFDWLDVPGVIASADEILEYPMVDRNPLERWTEGRSTLLGDAAHAMYPNGSNGASQAIIDARTLAYELATAGDVDLALAAYDERRRPATAALLELTRQQGPERVMVLARERAPQGFERIEDVLSPAELTEIATGYKRAAGFDPATLNTRPSLSPAVARTDTRR